MASILLGQNGDRIAEIPREQFLRPDSDDCGEAQVCPLIPSDSYDAGDAFGEPDILPRIGDEYQAELPQLLGEPANVSCSRTRSHQNSLVGLPIPLTWIGSKKHEGPEIFSDSRRPNPKNLAETSTYSSGETGPSHYSMKAKDESQNLPSDESILECSGGGHSFLVPGLLSESWSETEKASFLLGLYIFEKNFVELKRFLETKEMGAILSFYYGEFYRSDVYRRWSEGRRTRSKKCVYGQRIFSGFRQQELLSRLLPRVSEERRSALLEVSKNFGEEKMLLVDYVSSLKALVGMNILVEAVAIGTGKQDLTRMALEPLRSNQAIPVRPEMPTGKRCSSLTTTEIIKFLSGDYRLSKARSNDLFWEAVWPRLLARGWHSEQPQNPRHVAGSNKHCLVFLMPGIKKFSRRKLVKGYHYFDSVTDVLGKVRKEPGLIDLDNEETDGNKKEEGHERAGKKKLKEDENYRPTRHRRSYLQPRTSNCSMDDTRFTVVDTSLSDGKVRELRALPSETSNMMSISLVHTQGGAQVTLEENNGESDATNTITPDAYAADNPTAKTSRKTFPARKKHDDNSSFQDTHTVYPDISKTSGPDLKNKKGLIDKKQSRKVPKPHLRRKQEQGDVDYTAPISKRCRRLTANGCDEVRDGVIRSSIAPRSGNSTSYCSSGTREFNENVSSQVRLCQDKLLSSSSSKGDKLLPTSSSKGSPHESIKCNPVSSIHAKEPSPENTRTPFLIDLNLPQLSPEIEDYSVATDMRMDQNDGSIKPENHCLSKSSDIEAGMELPSTVNPLRHSTRNRPPTTRALEAVADGYLTVNRRRRSRDTSSRGNIASRRSQRARRVVAPNDSPNSSMASHIEEAENGVSNTGTNNMFSKFHIPTEANNESVPRQ
ncbi:uncharacterized protein LOC105156897 [Sesamum indicum]|uniref:Uncharacterized protein LOC105156897 n=1 Tax=Sesamum indicum TaxID=4182 RepID=A0A6I9SN48_SESIN|nr:uncharacterized protein LOC105156897 [Sesamum indicum]XP_011071456.1 uncharacterized protein LOC105156897 [Sesamum indicum]